MSWSRRLLWCLIVIAAVTVLDAIMFVLSTGPHHWAHRLAVSIVGYAPLPVWLDCTAAVLFHVPPYVAVGLVIYILMETAWHRRQGLGDPRCRKCGHRLRGLSTPRCPECGEAI